MLVRLFTDSDQDALQLIGAGSRRSSASVSAVAPVTDASGIADMSSLLDNLAAASAMRPS